MWRTPVTAGEGVGREGGREGRVVVGWWEGESGEKNGDGGLEDQKGRREGRKGGEKGKKVSEEKRRDTTRLVPL